MKQRKAEIEVAIEGWLQAYDGYEQYLAATERLYIVFAHSWQGPRRYLAEAFTEFRKVLVRSSVYSHLDITDVHPNRHPVCR